MSRTLSPEEQERLEQIRKRVESKHTPDKPMVVVGSTRAEKRVHLNLERRERDNSPDVTVDNDDVPPGQAAALTRLFQHAGPDLRWLLDLVCRLREDGPVERATHTVLVDGFVHDRRVQEMLGPQGVLNTLERRADRFIALELKEARALYSEVRGARELEDEDEADEAKPQTLEALARELDVDVDLGEVDVDVPHAAGLLVAGDIHLYLCGGLLSDEQQHQLAGHLEQMLRERGPMTAKASLREVLYSFLFTKERWISLPHEGQHQHLKRWRKLVDLAELAATEKKVQDSIAKTDASRRKELEALLEGKPLGILATDDPAELAAALIIQDVGSFHALDDRERGILVPRLAKVLKLRMGTMTHSMLAGSVMRRHFLDSAAAKAPVPRSEGCQLERSIGASLVSLGQPTQDLVRERWAKCLRIACLAVQVLPGPAKDPAPSVSGSST